MVSKVVRVGVWLLGVALVVSASAQEKNIDADIVLSGGTIVDGTGAAAVTGDVALRDGRIVAVGSFKRGTVGQVIDCRGMIICPGFIDLHNHSDRGIVDSKTRA